MCLRPRRHIRHFHEEAQVSIVSVLIGLLAAVLFFVVATALIAFSHSTLVFGLIALIVFFLVASGHVPLRR